MSFKGGYKIINLNGVSVSSTPLTISGLYDLILDNHEKMIVISGLKSGGVLYDDSPAFVSMDADSNLILQMGMHKLTVTDEDAVTFEDVEQAIKNDIESIESDVTSLEGDVNTLEDTVKREVTTLNVPSEATYTASVHDAIKFGALCQIRYLITGYVGTGNYDTIGTLPTDFRPGVEVLKRLDVSGGASAFLRIKTNGEIQINIATDTNTSIYLNEVFMI